MVKCDCFLCQSCWSFWSCLCVSQYFCFMSACSFFVCFLCRIHFLFVALKMKNHIHKIFVRSVCMFTNKKPKPINNKILILFKKWWSISVWCPKHDWKTLVRNRNHTNTTIINKNIVSFVLKTHKTCLEKSSKFTLSIENTTVNYKWQN